LANQSFEEAQKRPIVVRGDFGNQNQVKLGKPSQHGGERVLNFTRFSQL